MRHVPDDDDREEVEAQRVQAWMLACIALNPSYVHWGPYEDYMWKEGEGWNSRVIIESWAEMGFHLDDLNEVVNFYFYAERDAVMCVACDGSGVNAATKKLSDTFYEHKSAPGECWRHALTDDEIAALVQGGRLRDLTRSEPETMPTLADVNAWDRKCLGHDAINQWILVKTRAKRLGVYGKCEVCAGRGDCFAADEARLGLVLWVLHPRKGCSRGVDVKNIQQSDLPAVRAYLAEAASRNAERFAKAVARLGE